MASTTEVQNAIRAVAQLAAACPVIKDVEAVCERVSALDNYKNELDAECDRLKAQVADLAARCVTLTSECDIRTVQRDALNAEVGSLRERLSVILG